MNAFNENEALAYWRRGVALRFPQDPDPQPIEDNPTLFNIAWQELTAEELTALTQYPFPINGVWRLIHTAGWQRFWDGMSVLHPERTGEDIHVISGTLGMGKTDTRRARAETRLVHGLLPLNVLPEMNFMLALHENYHEASPIDHLMLHALANINRQLPLLSISDQEYHEALSFGGETWVLAVKHEAI